MHNIILNAQLALFAAQDKTFSSHLLVGDAVSNTNTLLKKLLKAVQVVGFTGGLVIGGVLFVLLMAAGERGRSAVKGHLGWLVAGIIGLFAVAGIATLFKSYATSSFGSGG